MTRPIDAIQMESNYYRFGDFELFPARRMLLLGGAPVPVTPRAFDLLLALVERSGRLVSKNELLTLVWPALVVENNSLQVQISLLRRILGQQSIATVPGRGYQFTLLADRGQACATGSPLPSPSHVATGTAPIGNLPAHLPPLFGRVDDAVALARMIERHRLVSAVGPGGIGKTRLAQTVAHTLRHHYPDGVWLAELASLSLPEQVVPTLARLLGQPPTRTEAALDALGIGLQERKLLLVLDNCEHLPEAICEAVARLIDDAPGVRLLVTSQQPLRLADEQIYRLQALSVPTRADADSALHHGAVELFVARAHAADARFALDAGNVDAVVEICARLDGMPLAIELAAARVPLLGVQGVRERLDERFRLLTGGAMRAALPRHQTLRAALDWSHALLSSDEQQVLGRLSVFVGSFSLAAAQFVASDDDIDAWAVLDHLAALVEKSWVVVEGGAVLRYRLLESNRAFALEHLTRSGVDEAIRRKHAQSIADTLVGGDTIEGSGARIQRIGPDLDNARAAVAWATGTTGDTDIAIALAGATHLLWEAQGCNEEGDRLHRAVTGLVNDETQPRLAARFWFAVSNLGFFTGLDVQAEAGLKAAELFGGLGDRYWRFRALLSAAQKLSWAGHAAAADKALSDANRLLDPNWPACAPAFLEHGLGTFKYFTATNPDDARPHFLAMAAIGRQTEGDGFLDDVADLFLILIDHALGNFAAAANRGFQTLSRPVGRMGTRNRTIFMGTLGAALAGLGRIDEANGVLRETVLQARRALGSTEWVFNHVALLVACQGRLADAAQLLGYIDGSKTAGSISQSPSQRRSYDETAALVTRGIDARECRRLRSAGGQLSEVEVTGLAFPDGRQTAWRPPHRNLQDSSGPGA